MPQEPLRRRLWLAQSRSCAVPAVWRVPHSQDTSAAVASRWHIDDTTSCWLRAAAARDGPLCLYHRTRLTQGGCDVLTQETCGTSLHDTGLNTLVRRLKHSLAWDVAPRILAMDAIEEVAAFGVCLGDGGTTDSAVHHHDDAVVA